MTEHVASLPAYDLPELRSVTDAWWTGLAGHLRRQGIDGVPEQLTRGPAFESTWRDPFLLLSQTCGYPLMTAFQDVLRPIATPVYACEGCTGAQYSSAIIVREDSSLETLADLRGRHAAINAWNSHSGMNALRHTIAHLARDGSFFADITVTGAHVRSVSAVREGRADVAAVDCVTWALLGRAAPSDRAGLRVLTWSVKAPALPYVVPAAATAERADRVLEALRAAANDPELESVRERLLIRGFESSTLSLYAAITDIEQEAFAAGYRMAP